MHVSQLVSTPEGLRAIYLVLVRDGEGQKTHIIDRPVDAVGLLELEANDIRANPRERQGASKGRKTKVVGIIMEGMLEPQPASTATGWFERLYGEDFLAAELLGYSRSDHTVDEIMEAVEQDRKSGVEYPEGAETPEMRETRRYWVKAVRLATERLNS